jgi:Flp pilus assembly pilin Flp
MTTHLSRFIHDESGNTMIEYALMLCFITLVCVAAFRQLGGESGSMYDRVFNRDIGSALK